MRGLLHFLDRLVGVLAGISVVVLVALMIFIFADALFREFGSPLEGGRDLTSLGLALITLCGVPLAGRNGGNIVVDLLPEFPSRFLNACREALVRLVAAGLFGILAWQATIRAEEAVEFNEASNLLGIPFLPFFLVMAVSAGLYTLTLLVELVLVVLGKPVPALRGAGRPESAA